MFLTIPSHSSICEYVQRPKSQFVYAKIGIAFKPIQAIVSVTHMVKFSRASIGQRLSSLLKSSEKEFTLIQSTTYCRRWRETLSPPECPERLVSEKRMEALPAARDWPPGAGAFCQGQFQWGKNIYSVAEGERQEDNKDISVYSHSVNNRFLKKQIVKGQGTVIGVQHFIRS